MSSRVFQSVVMEAEESTSRTIGVIDANGAVNASELSRIGETMPNSVEAITAEHGGTGGPECQHLQGVERTGRSV